MIGTDVAWADPPGVIVIESSKVTYEVSFLREVSSEVRTQAID